MFTASSSTTARMLGGSALVDALAALYSHVYAVPGESVQAAAEQRALAMRVSDDWVR